MRYIFPVIMHVLCAYSIKQQIIILYFVMLKKCFQFYFLLHDLRTIQSIAKCFMKQKLFSN